ncbi:MAG: VCBS repeat-containing protein [Candidatus Thermoplasmatota archaeon]
MKKAVILLLFLLLLQFYQDTNAYEKIEYVKVPNNIYVTNASMKIIPVSNPMKPCIDIGDDGIIDWAFDGIGYGSMGEQNFFGENKSKTIEFEKNAKINITLPKLANISNAELEVSFKKEQKFSQIEKIGIGKGMITSIEICDIDNDGDLDIAYGVGSLFGVELSEGGFYVSINSNGSYADIKPIDLIGMSIQEIKSGDMDKNGYIDFVGAGGNGNFYFLKNYGLHFSREVIKVGNGMMNAIALADLDNDGKEDIIGGSSTGTVYFSKATNNGSFENATQIAKTGYAILKIITGDMDNDYDIDIVVGGSKYLSYLENKNNNFEIKQIALGEDVKQVFDIKICDIDSDGDMDIITSAGKTELAVGSKGYIYKLINNGKEFSAPLIMKKFDEFALFSIEIGDIDFDGEIDIVGGTTNFKFLLLKKEKDSFKDILIDGNASNIINELGLGDIDNDGDLDLVGGCGDGFLYFSKNLLFMNYDTEINILGNKIFSKKSPSFSTPLKIRSGSNKKIMSVLVRDINKDGKKDIIGGNSNGDIYIAYNENETFENVKKIIGNFSSDIYSIKTLDKDNDGNLDIAASIYSVSSNSSPFLFFVSEKKNGNFSNSYIHSNDVGDYASATLSIDIGDIDSDGDTDIVCAGTLQDLKNFTLYGRVYLCLNENSNFSNVSILKEMAGGIGDLKLIDMNRDGKLDIVFGHTTISLESEVYILFNENSSFKNEKKLYAGKDLITGISIGDLDLDGDMDIVCGKANVFNPYKESDILYFENILNEFEYRTVFTAPAEIIHLILGDLDRNGYLDIVACSIDGNFYIIKNQLGNLSENITIHSGGGAVFGIDIEDINNDGTYEIIGGNNDTNFYVIKQKEQSFSESIDFSSNAKLAVKEMIGVVDHYGNEMVNISLELFSKEKTKLTFSNLSIVYNYVANLLDFSKVLNRYIEKYKTMEKEVKIPIKKSVEKGDILLSEFEIEYNSKPVILSSSPENKTYINEGGSETIRKFSHLNTNQEESIMGIHRF